MSHDSITRCVGLLAALCALAGAPAAQAFVVTTTVGDTTTYFEDFNGGTDFQGDAWTPISPTHFSDNFIELGVLGGSVSRFLFTSDVPIAALSLDFRYTGRLETANGTVSLSRVEDNGSLSTYFFTTLDDTPGGFSRTNPGLNFDGSPSGNDAPFSLILANLPAGTHLLSFDYIVPLVPSVDPPQVRVDDVLLSVTAVPEPASLLTMCAGLVGLAARRRKRRTP
jgi:hypothetical protein